MRCLLTIALLALCFSFAVAQDADNDDAQDNASAKAAAINVQVEYFPCDANDPLDLNNPGLVDQLIDYGIAVDPADDEQDIIGSLLTMSREKPVEAKAFAVRITNNAPKAIAINPKTVVLALAKYAGGDMSSRSVSKRINASPISAWAGRKSLLGKRRLSPKAKALGVVYFEVASDDLAGGEIPEVEYVVGEGAGVAGRPNEHLLPAVGLEWKVPLEAGARHPPASHESTQPVGTRRTIPPSSPASPAQSSLPFPSAKRW